MKRIFYISALALMASCSGTVDPENDQPIQDIPAEFTAPYTLSVDKTEVESDGVDVVTFSLKDAYDREMLSDMKTLEKINIISDKGTRVPRMTTTATFIADGEYSFYASYLGQKSENTVTVTAKNRAKYEVFHKNVALFKCTSVSCPACPGLGRTLHSLSDEAKAHSVVLSIHGNYSGRDPFALYVGDTDLATYMMGRFGGTGWPTLIYELDEAVTGAGSGSQNSSSAIAQRVMQHRIDNPATCGIKVTSVQLEGTVFKVKATMKSSTGGDYDLACAVLRNGLEYQGGYSVNDDGVYDEVVVALSESFVGYYKGEEVAKDAEISEEFAFDFGENVPSEAELKGYYVAVYAHRKADRGSVMDNIVTCAYGESTDYILN